MESVSIEPHLAANAKSLNEHNSATSRATHTPFLDLNRPLFFPEIQEAGNSSGGQ